MSETDDLRDIIEQNAKGIKQASGDSGSVQNHSLLEQIEADRYLRNRSAASSRGMPLRHLKLIPPDQE